MAGQQERARTRIGVTGASGRLGQRVARQVFELVEPSDVVLMTRRPEALFESALGPPDRWRFTARRVDFDEPHSLAAAFAGVDRLLLISTDELVHRVEQHRAAVQAARDAGVRHVVYTSVLEPSEGNPLSVASDHRETEKVLRDSGIAWTLLRHSLYAEIHAAAVAQAARTGELVTNARDGRVAYVSRDDCAAAAAAVLASEGHECRSYDITGPELVDQDDLASLAGDLAGAPVRVTHVDDQQFVVHLGRLGLGKPLARKIASIGAATREGWLERVSTAVEALTGRPPRPLREVLVAGHPDRVQPASQRARRASC